jgi:transposase
MEIFSVSALKGSSLSLINSDLKTVFCKNLPTYKTISRWYNRFKSGETDLEDRPNSGRPKTGTNEANCDKVSNILDKNRR